MALVTGASGFIGSHLVKELKKKKYRVRCLVRNTSKTELLKRHDVEIWYGDLTDKKSLKGIGKEVDIVFHLAAIGDINAISKKYYDLYEYVNVKGTENLLKECMKYDIKKFVHFSSIAAMGFLKKEGRITETDIYEAKTAYEKSKRDSELVVLNFWKKYKIPVVILRPTMVYGEGETKEFSKIKKSVKLRVVPIIGDGKTPIHMVHVKDVVNSAIIVAKRGKPGETYLISGEHYSWDELVDLIAQKMGIKVYKIHIPIIMVRPFVVLIENISKIFNFIPLFNSKRLDNLKNYKVFDISKAKKQLGYNPKIKLSRIKCK